jgi:DNA-3-methyladenine glycosylase II
MAHYTTSGTLPVTPVFDFSKSLAFLGDFTPMNDEQEVTATTLTKAVMLNGRCIAFRVQDAGNADEPMVGYTLFSEEPLDETSHRQVAERISFFLSLQDDLRPFYALARQDADFAPVIQRLYGLHHVKFLTLCEIACWSVLGQHRALPLARKMKRALVERYGSSITIEGQTYWAFPEFERLLSVREEEFAALIKNERSAQYLYNVVQDLSQIDEDFLCNAPYDEVEAALRSIKGIGRWSAAFILFRGLGRMERILGDMQPFQDALKKLYRPGVTVQQLEQHYGSWIGYWSFYLRNAA